MQKEDKSEKGVKTAMMGKRRHAKVNVLMCAVAVLLCATLYSTHLVGGLYARYTVSGNGGDHARVAAFNIEQTGTIFETLDATVTPGTTQSAELTINNKSEVAVAYTLTVTNVTKNLPLKFTLTPTESSSAGDTNADGANANKAPEFTSEKHENGVSTSSATQIPGEHSDRYTLNIVWDASENSEDDLARMGMVDYITIAVTATQID